MAFLSFNAQNFELSAALSNIGDLKLSVADGLRGQGFTDVVNTPGEVAGNHAGGVRLSVSYLPTGGRSFLQVVAAGGDTADGTRLTIDAALNVIRNLHSH
jgi:hypothetical protein